MAQAMRPGKTYKTTTHQHRIGRVGKAADKHCRCAANRKACLRCATKKLWKGKSPKGC